MTERSKRDGRIADIGLVCQHDFENGDIFDDGCRYCSNEKENGGNE